MQSHKYMVRVQCAQEGCQFSTQFGFDTKKEERAFRAKDQTWLCQRHSDPGGILSLDRDRLVRARELVSYETQHVDGGASYCYWTTPEKLESGDEKGGSAFVHGDGWKAWAKDFPPGTKIEVETRVTVILPEPEY